MPQSQSEYGTQCANNGVKLPPKSSAEAVSAYNEAIKRQQKGN